MAYAVALLMKAAPPVQTGANRKPGTAIQTQTQTNPNPGRALAYVETNPVRIVNAPEQYRWSTAEAHCREDGLDRRLHLDEWKRRFDGKRWSEALRIGVDEEQWDEGIREATRHGNPLGSEAFVERVSRALGRDLRPRPPGRPRKQGTAGAAKMG